MTAAGFIGAKNNIIDMKEISIIPYDVKYCDETVIMKRDSKEKAIGQKDMYSFSESKNFLDNILAKNYKTYIALLDNKVTGIIAFNETEVNQLYIHNEFQRIGIGKKLLDIAKTNSTGVLSLYTFDINKNAQRFYEKNGFKIIGRNYENEEKLSDIKYEWKREI